MQSTCFILNSLNTHDSKRVLKLRRTPNFSIVIARSYLFFYLSLGSGGQDIYIQRRMEILHNANTIISGRYLTIQLDVITYTLITKFKIIINTLCM